MRGTGKIKKQDKGVNSPTRASQEGNPPPMGKNAIYSLTHLLNPSLYE